jgi:hypothetical protein
MTTFNNIIIIVQAQVIQERIPSREVEGEELTKAFNSRFFCIREKELDKQQRLEKIGAIAVYDAAVDKLRGTYRQMATNGRAYLGTLSPVSD